MYIYNIQATSSITKNFAVQKQAEKFANAIEKSYQEFREQKYLI